MTVTVARLVTVTLGDNPRSRGPCASTGVVSTAFTRAFLCIAHPFRPRGTFSANVWWPNRSMNARERTPSDNDANLHLPSRHRTLDTRRGVPTLDNPGTHRPSPNRRLYTYTSVTALLVETATGTGSRRRRLEARVHRWGGVFRGAEPPSDG